MKRGWILVLSVALELLMIVGISELDKFLPLSTFTTAAIGVAAIGILSFSLVYFWWAPNNLFFTFVKEGTVKIVSRGGEARRALVQWKGKTLDQDWNIIDGNETCFLGGFRFYGLWPIDDIHVYKFSWTSVTESGEPKPHLDERLDYVMLPPDVYLARVRGAEDNQLLPLDVNLLLTIKIVNPYKALFAIEGWLEAVINRIEPSVRDFITTQKYDDLITKPEEIGRQIMRRLEGLEDGDILKIFEREYGILVQAIQVTSINPPDEYREATLAAFLAEKRKVAVEIDATAEAVRIERVFAAVDKFEDLGRLIRVLEAVEKSPLAASLSVQAVPGLQEALQGVFDKKA